MSDLLQFVKQEPLSEKPSDKASCPVCAGLRLDFEGSHHTLIGGGDGTRDGDPNHWWTHYRCQDCATGFARETKAGNVWYTSVGRVLCGVPNCYEHYVLACKTCGGDIRREYTAEDGVTPVTTLSTSFGPYKRYYRTFWHCVGCGARIETDYDNWEGP